MHKANKTQVAMTAWWTASLAHVSPSLPRSFCVLNIAALLSLQKACAQCQWGVFATPIFSTNYHLAFGACIISPLSPNVSHFSTVAASSWPLECTVVKMARYGTKFNRIFHHVYWTLTTTVCFKQGSSLSIYKDGETMSFNSEKTRGGREPAAAAGWAYVWWKVPFHAIFTLSRIPILEKFMCVPFSSAFLMLLNTGGHLTA